MEENYYDVYGSQRLKNDDQKLGVKSGMSSKNDQKAITVFSKENFATKTFEMLMAGQKQVKCGGCGGNGNGFALINCKSCKRGYCAKCLIDLGCCAEKICGKCQLVDENGFVANMCGECMEKAESGIVNWGNIINMQNTKLDFFTSSQNYDYGNLNQLQFSGKQVPTRTNRIDSKSMVIE